MSTAAPARERRDERLNRILQALHDCIIEKGYASTTLKDVAHAADMSPSHLLYYFRGKGAILDHYFQNISDRILDRIEGFKRENPERQIERFADLFFAGKGITKSEIGFMLECFGVAVHHRELRLKKSALDRRCKDYLTELFEQTSGAGAIADTEAKRRAKDAAEAAYAMLIGMRTAVYFDDRISLARARRLFRAAMLRLADKPLEVG
jgi:AcrR family transcriptional regulator